MWSKLRSFGFTDETHIDDTGQILPKARNTAPSSRHGSQQLRHLPSELAISRIIRRTVGLVVFRTKHMKCSPIQEPFMCFKDGLS